MSDTYLLVVGVHTSVVSAVDVPEFVRAALAVRDKLGRFVVSQYLVEGWAMYRRCEP